MRFAFWGCWFVFFFLCGSSINSIQLYFCIKFAYLLCLITVSGPTPFGEYWNPWFYLPHIGGWPTALHLENLWESAALPSLASALHTLHHLITSQSRWNLPMAERGLSTAVPVYYNGITTASRVRLWRRRIASKQGLRTWHPSCAALCETRIFLTSIFWIPADSFQWCAGF